MPAADNLLSSTPSVSDRSKLNFATQEAHPVRQGSSANIEHSKCMRKACGLHKLGGSFNLSAKGW